MLRKIQKTSDKNQQPLVSTSAHHESTLKEFEWVYGYHAVRILLQTRPNDVLQLLIASNRQDKRSDELLALAQSAKITCRSMPKAQMDKLLSKDVRHQGFAAKYTQQQALSEVNLIQYVKNASEPVVLLVLDGVQDPHNLGACLRSANAFGVTAVITPKDRAALKTEIVKKVASGAAEQTPLITVTNVHRTLKQLQEAGVWFVGLDAKATAELSEIDMKGHIGIVIGGEHDGLRRLTHESCDYLVRIPMQGVVESLNVSVATGVALYEVQRQRIYLKK